MDATRLLRDAVIEVRKAVAGGRGGPVYATAGVAQYKLVQHWDGELEIRIERRKTTGWKQAVVYTYGPLNDMAGAGWYGSVQTRTARGASGRKNFTPSERQMKHLASLIRRLEWK